MMFNPFRYFRSAKPGTSGSLRSQPAARRGVIVQRTASRDAPAATSWRTTNQPFALAPRPSMSSSSPSR